MSFALWTPSFTHGQLVPKPYNIGDGNQRVAFYDTAGKEMMRIRADGKAADWTALIAAIQAGNQGLVLPSVTGPGPGWVKVPSTEITVYRKA